MRHDKNHLTETVIRKARELVTSGQAPSFRAACAELARHSAAARAARRNRQRLARLMWWNK